MRAIGVVNVRLRQTTGQRRRHQGQQLAARMGPTWRISRINMAVHQSTQSQMMGQGHRQKQFEISRRAATVKGNVDAGELIRW